MRSAPKPSDPYLALWTLSTLVGPDALPRPRVVVRFDVTRTGPSRFWLVVGPAEREVCAHDPGPATTPWSPPTRRPWSAGTRPARPGNAQRAGSMTVMGPPWSVRTLAGWGRLSPFADVAPARAQTSSARTADALLTTSISSVLSGPGQPDGGERIAERDVQAALGRPAPSVPNRPWTARRRTRAR